MRNVRSSDCAYSQVRPQADVKLEGGIGLIQATCDIDAHRAHRRFPTCADTNARAPIGRVIESTAAIDKDRQYLQNLEQTQERDKAELTQTLTERTNSMKKMDGDARSKQKRLEKLRAEDTSLAEIIDRLASTEKKPAEAAPKTEKETAKADEKKPSPTATPIKTRFTPDKAFSSLKGALSWPIAGKIIHPYDSAKNEKQRWRGVVIAAPGGTKVKAVARGRVLFSGWMNTYGHMIIIEHDSNYISLYGYNRAVYKKEGAIVNANETIAAVGASGGQSRDGLYFEIRQGKTPQNPARWCR